MNRTIDKQQIGEELVSRLDGICSTGEGVIIEAEGKPVAAVVPFDVLQWYESRLDAQRELGQLMEKVSSRHSGMDDESLNRLIEQEIAAVRAEQAEIRRQAAESE